MATLRPVQHLTNAMHLYPDTARQVDAYRTGRGTTYPSWPDWCFLPMAAWYGIVSADHGTRGPLPVRLIPDVARLAAIGTWRYSQGVYRIDSDLSAALLNSELSGAIPSEVLYRLPEWCVYVETPALSWLGHTLHGFWAHLECDANTQRSELRLLLDLDTDLVAIPLHIGDWTIVEAVERMIAEATAQASGAGLAATVPSGYAAQLPTAVTPLVSLILYLCAEAPEIEHDREPGMSPSRPRPKKTKQGWRLFPPPRPTIWTVGARTGAQLRSAQDTASDGTDRTVTPHLRRGHWHGYWTGPRTGPRRFIYRWISPLVVGLERDDKPNDESRDYRV